MTPKTRPQRPPQTRPPQTRPPSRAPPPQAPSAQAAPLAADPVSMEVSVVATAGLGDPFADEARPLVDQSGVKLKQRGACFDLGECRLRAVDAANADKRNFYLRLQIDAAEHGGGSFKQRRAGKSAAFSFAGFFHAFGCLERSVRKSLDDGQPKQASYRLFGKKYDSLGTLLERVAAQRETLDAVDGYGILMFCKQ